MNEPNQTRPIPLLGEITLDSLQQIEHALAGGFRGTVVPGLEGALQQRIGRPSHQIYLSGLLFGEKAREQLKSLQLATEKGDALTFSADITTALDIQRVVIADFHAAELAGQPHQFFYEMILVESPPLPPPAQVSAFGGLDGFGAGDLGFDTDITGELEGLAGDIADAVDEATELIDQMDALSNLDALQLGGVLDPLSNSVDEVSKIGTDFKSALEVLTDAFKS